MKCLMTYSLFLSLFVLFSDCIVIEVITKFDFDVTCYSSIKHALVSIQAVSVRITLYSSTDGCQMHDHGLMGSKNSIYPCSRKYPWMTYAYPIFHDNSQYLQCYSSCNIVHTCICHTINSHRNTRVTNLLLSW